VRITVLGKSPSWPDAGGACSGYLVEDDETCLLLDCGSGVLAQLRRVRAYVAVHGIVVSHMHADHFLDLIPFACALTYSPRQQAAPVAGGPATAEPARPQLLLPPGGREVVRTVAAAGHQAGLVERAFRAREYDVAAHERVGTLRLRFQPVPHFIATNAVEVTSDGGGGRFVFGADHRPTDALCGFADNTDLLMLEATLPRAESDGPRGHLTAAEAGEHATRCAAVRLVLTHMSDELDADWALAEARRAFAGPVEVAQAGAVYTV
jgi:ribonuclease BN (tRNA processing enzyme)